MSRKMIKKYFLEVQFKASGSILDKLGDVADRILISCDFLTDWNIPNNRNSVQFRNKDNKNFSCFISYRNFGFESRYPNNTDFFKENAISFIRNSWEHIPNRIITRIGIKTQIFIEGDNFLSHFETYKNKFLGLGLEDLNQFNAGSLDDVGFMFNFSQENKKFCTMTGPMKKEQALPIFNIKDNEMPDCGIYFEVDCFQDSFTEESRRRDLINFISSSVEKSNEMMLTVKEWILNNNSNDETNN